MRLTRAPWRYNELRRELAGISHKMLTQHLRELEHHGLITRTVHPVVPPHVDYSLTALGRTTVPIIESLREWGSAFRTKRARIGRPGCVTPGADVVVTAAVERDTLSVHMNGEEHGLEAGDSIYFDATVSHGYRRSGRRRCSAIVVTAS